MAEYHEGPVYDAELKADLAFPCATQRAAKIDAERARRLINGLPGWYAEGAEHAEQQRSDRTVSADSGVLFAPGKAANAGGVATSALEMSQNSMRLAWIV